MSLSSQLNARRNATDEDFSSCSIIASAPTLYGTVEIVEYAAGQNRTTMVAPALHMVEMLLNDQMLERRGKLSRISGTHAVGDVIFIPAGRSLRCWWPSGGPVRAVRCYYRDQEGEPGPEFNSTELIALLSVDRPHLRSAMMSLGVEISAPSFRSELLCDGLAAQIAVELGRSRRRREVDRGAGLTPAQMRLIDRRISGFRVWPSVDELADICAVSRRHFFRLFEATTGMSPRHYVVARQIDRAKRLLRVDGAMVKQVAYLCGFDTHSAFSAAFRRITGAKPTEFRQRPRPDPHQNPN